MMRQEKEEVLSEMWGNAVWGWACKNSVGLSMYEGHMETVKYTWVKI